MTVPQHPVRPLADSDNLAAMMHAVAAQRDRAAFAELFGHFAPRLKAYLRRMTVAEDQLDDLVQDIMITIWRRAVLYDSRKANVSTWVFTIARNKRIDAVRRERHPEFDPNDPALVGPAVVTPDQNLDAEQTAGRVRLAIEGLPEDQARVLRKSFYEDKPHSIIAKELDLPLGTVKSRLRLAVHRLRGALEELS